MNKALGYRLRARLGSERGFTLIEVLVSALLVTLIAGAVAGGLIANTDFTADQHRRSEAQALAQQDQERLKGLSAEQLDNLSQTYNATEDKNQFTVTSKAYYLSSNNNQACTTAGGASATYFKTISTVTWTNPSTNVVKTLATDESVITPPAGGGILTQFHDQTASALPGVSVSASGPDSDAGTSDTTGCVIFSALPTGNYTLSFTDIGYVDPNGNASPLASSANVASTGFAAPTGGNPVEMGQGGGLTGLFKTTAPNASNISTLFTAQADGMSWYSSGGAGIPMSSYRTAPTTAAMSTSVATTTASGTSSSNGLFPFATLNPTSYTNNYQVWAGTCRQEQPPSGINMASVSPGSYNGSFQVTEPALNLTTTFKNSSNVTSTVTPNDVKITFTSASGTSCTDKWSFTSPYANAGPSGAYVFGLPYASGTTSGAQASASGQTGSITVCADYKYPTTGKYYEVSTSAFTDQFTPPTPTVTSQTIALIQSGTGASTQAQCT